MQNSYSVYWCGIYIIHCPALNCTINKYDTQTIYSIVYKVKLRYNVHPGGIQNCTLYPGVRYTRSYTFFQTRKKNFFAIKLKIIKFLRK
jgi:hypothetical protein